MDYAISNWNHLQVLQKQRASKYFYQNSHILGTKMCREAFEHGMEKRVVENSCNIVKFRRIKKMCCIYFQNKYIPLQVMLKREVGKYLRKEWCDGLTISSKDYNECIQVKDVKNSSYLYKIYFTLNWYTYFGVRYTLQTSPFSQWRVKLGFRNTLNNKNTFKKCS